MKKCRVESFLLKSRPPCRGTGSRVCWQTAGRRRSGGLGLSPLESRLIGVHEKVDVVLVGHVPDGWNVKRPLSITFTDVTAVFQELVNQLDALELGWEAGCASLHLVDLGQLAAAAVIKDLGSSSDILHVDVGLSKRLRTCGERMISVISLNSART